MSRKVLFVATVLRMHVLVFHLPYMRWFQEQGYEVHLCCANDTPDPHPQVPYCDRWVELPFSRSPFSADNREVFRRLKQLIDAEDYALIIATRRWAGCWAVWRRVRRANAARVWSIRRTGFIFSPARR